MTISGSEADILWQLATAAARTMALAAIAGLFLAVFRVKTTAVRLLTWTVVLYAGLVMPTLGVVLPPIRIPLPFGVSAFIPTNADFGSSATVPSRQFIVWSAPIAAAPDASAQHVTAARPVRSELSRPDAVSIPWTAVALGVYFAMAFLLLGRLFVGVMFARRLVRRANPVNDSRVALASGKYLCSGRRFARICESQMVSVPLTVGVLSPTVILPCAWREWDDDKLAGVLTHERSHVARWDCLSQYLSLVHRAIFWFSPLAWWLNRHIIDLAEQASDEETLSRGADQNQYARTLLGFLETVQAAPGRVRWQGVSMASSGRAEKRLEKILIWRGENKMGAKKLTISAVVVLAVTSAYLVAAARPIRLSPTPSSATGTQDQAPASVGQPVQASPIEAAPTSPSHPQSPNEMSIGAPPTASPAVPLPPESSMAALAEQDSASSGNQHSFYSHYGDEQRFVIVSSKSEGFTMSGSSEDAHHVEKLKQQIPGDFIWFQRDEKSYIIRDQATVERARELWAPQEALGKKQEELGKQQEALGKQQEELGAHMQAVRMKVPDMTAELDKLKAELKQLGPDASMEQIGRIQSEIGELQSRIGEIQSHAGDEQSKIGEQMGALGEKQGELGRQQGELGRQQGELAEKASREMKQLLDDAMKKGMAQPEAPGPDSGSL